MIKAFMLLFFVLSTPGYSHDHLNLEHGVPLEVEDAIVTPYLNREFHTYFEYEGQKDNKESFVLVPRIELGPARNFQVEVATPIEYGNAEENIGGNISVDFLYSLNRERIFLPASAIGGGVILPTGEGRVGYDTLIKLNLTKTLPVPISFQRMHFNLHWLQNAQPKDDERIHVMKYVFAYQIRIGTDDFLLIDYFLEHQFKKHDEYQMVEVGWRHQYNPLTVIASGIGTGVTDDSPDLRFNISFQRAINFP